LQNLALGCRRFPLGSIVARCSSAVSQVTKCSATAAGKYGRNFGRFFGFRGGSQFAYLQFFKRPHAGFDDMTVAGTFNDGAGSSLARGTCPGEEF